MTRHAFLQAFGGAAELLNSGCPSGLNDSCNEMLHHIPVSTSLGAQIYTTADWVICSYI